MNDQRLHNGRLGSTSLVLPDDAPEPDLQGEQIPTMSIGWPRILLVGRGDATAAFMRAIRGSLPFHVGITAMPDLAAAPVQLARRHYDLVVLLLPLLEGDADRARRALRAVSQHVLILVLDPSDSLDQAPVVNTAGADTYLSRPVHPDEFGARLAALLPPQRWALPPDWQAAKIGR